MTYWTSGEATKVAEREWSIRALGCIPKSSSLDNHSIKFTVENGQKDLVCDIRGISGSGDGILILRPQR